MSQIYPEHRALAGKPGPVLFKKGFFMGDKYLVCEISETRKQYRLRVYEVYTLESYSLAISKKAALRRMGNCIHFDRLLSQLVIRDHQLAFMG